jgi:hypothetical protein
MRTNSTDIFIVDFYQSSKGNKSRNSQFLSGVLKKEGGNNRVRENPPT